MINWNQIPFLRILLPFIAGIVAALAIGSNFVIHYNFIIAFAFAVCLLLIFHKYIIRNYGGRWISGILVNLFLFLFAYTITCRYDLKNQHEDLCYKHGVNDSIIAMITEPVSERENTCKIILSVESIKNNGVWSDCNGKTIAYFAKDTLSKSLKYGDRLIICGAFSEASPPRNPGEFDYRRYLALRSIYSEGFVKSGNWKLLQQEQGNIFFSLAQKLREKFLRIFQQNDINGEQYAVVGAVLLGYTDKIDADLFSAYQGTGVLHVLCVAGLHVGIVFLVLNFLLSFLDRYKNGKIFKAILLLLIIWFYAAITGFAPPVNRATTMITFVLIGKITGRSHNVYNSLAASVFCLLLIYPLWILNSGFQLSFVAVIGIVMLQKKIYNFWIPSNRLLNFIWLIVTVSIAAQIATLPLTMLYFHQFPNCFMITNVLVFPFMNLIIYCGMLVLMVSPFRWLSAIFSKILVGLITALNISIRYIEHLPFSMTKGISITPIEMVLIYCGIISLIYFFHSRKHLFLKLSLLAAIIMTMSFAFRSYHANTQKKLIVYDVKKSSAIDFISGKEHLLLSDSAFTPDSIAISQHLQNNWNNLLLHEPQYLNFTGQNEDSMQNNNLTFFRDGNLIQFYNKKLAVIDASNFLFKSDMPIKVDYLILSGNSKANISELLETYNPGMIIIDSSNSKWKTSKWMAECAALNQPCYSVLKSGAFEADL